ncbi:helix-turn-helix domain-containing protein [Pseudovibrio sp. Tun.PSC04-5.I4]|uniref:helix-turn-helix domain-containing protein n=1 Tax=Pseudovibrio sp. Tun.PSC04-5.I4 TaxID=1798213 RepID=UPI0008888E3D|nr:helix-turn-helix domain-containing protein [Pseudovibrio sp. Tun.PSC04-5.I4]SDR20084.1 Helix-turn-helix domain-containing protein [Pseudovibrio sp. Tun.PSC04-5.I4]
MSHEATNWAIKQKGLPPAVKIVLWHLCDRFNPDFGCFPKQKTLALDCEISRASLNRHLNELEERDLLQREKRWDEESRQQTSTRYSLAFEEGFVPMSKALSVEKEAAKTPEKPVSQIEPTPEKPVSQKQPIPCLKNGQSRVSNCDTNLVREPVREPVNERACASGNLEKKNSTPIGKLSGEAWQKRFKKALHGWPTVVGDSWPEVEKAWFALNEAEREQASSLISAYVNHCKGLGRTKICAFSKYLKEKRWEQLPETAKCNGGSVEVAKAYGKVWGVYRFADLLKPPNSMPKPPATIEGILNGGGEQAEAEKLRRLAIYGWPRVVDMHNHAFRRGGGLTVKGKLVPLASEFLQIRVGNDIWQAWKQLHGERGWPWFAPDRDLPDWVYMPKLLAEEFPSMLEAVRAALASFEDAYARFTGERATAQEAAE